MAVHDGNHRLNRGWRFGLWLAVGFMLSGALLFLADWEANRQEGLRIDSFSDSLADLAQISEAIIADRLRQYDNSLLVLRDAYAEDPQSISRTLELLRNGPLADRAVMVVLVDREGYLAFTDTPKAQHRLYLGDRPYFRFFADGGKDRLYIDEPIFGRVTKRHVLPLVRPIYDGQGKFFGVIAVSVLQETLGRLTPRLKLSGDTALTVVNRDGVVITRSRDLDRMQDVKLTQAQLAPMLKGESGVFFKHSWLGEKEHIIAYRHILYQNAQLIAFVDTTAGEVLRITSMQRRILLSGACFTSLVIIILLFVNLQRRKITKQFIEAQRLNLLAESDARLRMLMQTLPDMVWLKDPGGVFLFCNAMFQRLFGATEAEIIGKTDYDFVDKEQADSFREFDNRAVKEGKPCRNEEWVTFADDGHRVLLETIKAPLFDPAGNTVGVLGIARDITDRKNLEESLRERESLLRLITDNSPAYIAYIELEDLRYRFVNQKFTEDLGLSREEIMGKHIKEIIGESNYEVALKFIAEAKKGRSVSYENLFYTKQGKRWIRVNYVPDFNKVGEPVGIVVLGYDLTENRQTEENLKKSEELLNEVGNISKIGGWEMDLATRKAKWTRGTYDIIEIGYDQPIPGPDEHLEYYLPEYRAMVAAAMEDLIERDEPLDFTARARTAKGNIKWCRAVGRGIRQDGKCVKIYGTFQDVTEQKKAEQEKQNLEIQLRQAQKMEAIGTLAGGIAHDFNNMLAIILGYTEMAREDAPADTVYAGDLDKVIEAGNRARDLVKQILAFSRQAQIERIPLQLQSLIKEALRILRSSIPTTIEIKNDIDSNCGIVFADPTQVQQILMNLCTNANHAMEETGGVLRIELKCVHIGRAKQQPASDLKPGEYVELVVSDTGTGIGADMMDKIFDPYFTTKEQGKGTGMGLAIVHGIITSYGGSITVESTLGKGTAFHVYFPVLEKPELPLVKGVEEIPFGNERILFIDDEDLLAEMGKDILERLGYKVTVRNSSLDALTTFRNNPDGFDAVITDQTMPGMTGSDLARRILQIRPDIPIILCTGYSNLIDEASAKALGVKEFALKPLTKGVIAKLIRKALGKNPPSKQQQESDGIRPDV